MTVREEKAKRQRLYDLGWYEDDKDVWRCRTCKAPRYRSDCGICKRCETCYKCDPDTDAGKQAAQDYTKKKCAIIDFDIFGNKLDE